ASERTGFHQYTFPASDSAHIVIDLAEGIGDRPTRTFIQKLNDSTIGGYRYSRGWAPNQRIYFTAVFSKPFTHFSVYEDTVLQPTDSLTGRRTKGVVSFSTADKEKLRIKV